jgi:hypothetical protein
MWLSFSPNIFAISQVEVLPARVPLNTFGISTTYSSQSLSFSHYSLNTSYYFGVFEVSVGVVGVVGEDR